MARSEPITLPKTAFLYVFVVVLGLVLISVLFIGVRNFTQSPTAQAEPDGCFPPDAGLDPFLVDWYCGHLRAAGLGRLTADPAYRFTYLPSFHTPRIAIAYLEAGKPMVVGIVLSGRGGYEPGDVLKRTRRLLHDHEWRLLNQRLENAGMWAPTDLDRAMGVDGAQWILEGRRAGRYRLHDIWSPSAKEFPQYVKVCMYMLDLAGIQPHQQEISDYGLER